jgi:uncharacterized protein YkwD
MIVRDAVQWSLVLALALAGCGEESDSGQRAPAHPDAGRKRDAAASSDTDEDEGDTDQSDETGEVVDAGASERDASAHDAASASHDASTRDAAMPTTDAGGSAADGETGRMVGMTAAHNAVRAMVETTMSLPEMTWSNDLAAYAQEWADHLAQTACDAPMHRSGVELQAKRYGENLAAFAAFPVKPNSSAQSAVSSWAGEEQCYTFGPFDKGDVCNTSCYMKMSSDGCGHYTQIVWRDSTQVGCGVSTCVRGNGYNEDIWICNYAPAGNVRGVKPY